MPYAFRLQCRTPVSPKSIILSPHTFMVTTSAVCPQSHVGSRSTSSAITVIAWSKKQSGVGWPGRPI